MVCTHSYPITQRRITCITCQKQENNRLAPYFCNLIYIFWGRTGKDAIFHHQYMIMYMVFSEQNLVILYLQLILIHPCLSGFNMMWHGSSVHSAWARYLLLYCIQLEIWCVELTLITLCKNIKVFFHVIFYREYLSYREQTDDLVLYIEELVMLI